MAILCPGPSQEKPRSPEDPGDHRDLEPARAGWGDKMTEEKGGCNTFHDQNMEVSLGSSLDFPMFEICNAI